MFIIISGSPYEQMYPILSLTTKTMLQEQLTNLCIHQAMTCVNILYFDVPTHVDGILDPSIPFKPIIDSRALYYKENNYNIADSLCN